MRPQPALLFVLTALCAAPSAALDVRVLIASAPTVSVNTAPSDAPVSTLSTWDIGVRAGKLTLGGQDTASAVLSLPAVEGGTLGVAGRRYRGGLILRAEGGKVQAINAVDIEAYLRGVVPAEMPPLWAQAALRAQAIIARTYAAARINPAAPYDLCATTQCQVYEGVGKEHPLADAAIAATRAEVVSSAGKLADTYFSADSGGYTASSLEAWGRDVPYLRAQPDPTSPSAQKPWTVTAPMSSVQDVAGRYGVRLGKLSSVVISKLSASGRVTELSFTGENGSKTLAGADAGGLVRSLGAKSSKVSLKLEGGTLIVTGTGAGHGVGLSQWGAKGLAESGQSELALLSFYYPGAGISLLSAPQAGRPNLGPSLPLAEAARGGFAPDVLAADTEAFSSRALLPLLPAPL